MEASHTADAVHQQLAQIQGVPPPPPPCKTSALVRAMVGVVSATFGTTSGFALYNFTLVSRRHQVLLPSNFGILVLLAQMGGGGIVTVKAVIMGSVVTAGRVMPCGHIGALIPVKKVIQCIVAYKPLIPALLVKDARGSRITNSTYGIVPCKNEGC